MKRPIVIASIFALAAGIVHCDITLLGTGGGLDAAIDTQQTPDVQVEDVQYSDRAEPDTATADVVTVDAGNDATDSAPDAVPDAAPDAMTDAGADAADGSSVLTPCGTIYTLTSGDFNFTAPTVAAGNEIVLTADATDLAGAAQSKIKYDISKGFDVVAKINIDTNANPRIIASGLTIGWMKDAIAMGLGAAGNDLGLCAGGANKLKFAYSVGIDTYTNGAPLQTDLNLYDLNDQGQCVRPAPPLATSSAANDKLVMLKNGSDHMVEIRLRPGGSLVVLLDNMPYTLSDKRNFGDLTLLGSRVLLLTAGTGGTYRSKQVVKSVTVRTCQ
jgi:hypothetical protein